MLDTGYQSRAWTAKIYTYTFPLTYIQLLWFHFTANGQASL